MSQSVREEPLTILNGFRTEAQCLGGIGCLAPRRVITMSYAPVWLVPVRMLMYPYVLGWPLLLQLPCYNLSAQVKVNSECSSCCLLDLMKAEVQSAMKEQLSQMEPS